MQIHSQLVRGTQGASSQAEDLNVNLSKTQSQALGSFILHRLYPVYLCILNSYK